MIQQCILWGDQLSIFVNWGMQSWYFSLLSYSQNEMMLHKNYWCACYKIMVHAASSTLFTWIYGMGTLMHRASSILTPWSESVLPVPSGLWGQHGAHLGHQRSRLSRPISKIRMILLMDAKIWMTSLIIMFAVRAICIQDSIFKMSSESPGHTRPTLAPRWPHEPCYLGVLLTDT